MPTTVTATKRKGIWQVKVCMEFLTHNVEQVDRVVKQHGLHKDESVCTEEYIHATAYDYSKRAKET